MHPRSHTASVPNLHRAVAECTQPYGPPASVAAVRSLQAYLTDESCVDAVYRAILARACAEPQSEAVIAKCISLVRQYVGRHPPSTAVLAAIAAACQDLAASLPPSSGVQKSLLYLQSSVTRTADSTQPEGANKRLAKISARSAGSNASSRGVWPHAAANGDLAGSSSSARAAAAAAADNSVHSSTSEDVLVALQAKAAAPSMWGSADQQQQQRQQQQHQQRQHHQQQQAWQPEEASHDISLAAELEGSRTVPSEPVLPSWTFQPSALQELWGCGPDEEADLDWSARAPQLSPSLVPLVDGLPGMQELDSLSCQHIVDAITGADVSIQLRQMREITEVRRLQCGVTPELLQQAMHQSLASRSRRLFQPLPYTQQEQADILASDVAAVVEIMCGKPSPTTPSAITGMVGLEDPDTYWQQQPLAAAGPGVQQPLLLLYQQTSNLGGQQQPQQQRHAESIGQISSCILVKMVVDLWLSVGGAAAFPLVLRMLQQALYQLQPQHRARAFDILFNLSLHGSMLLPSVTSPPPSPQLHAAVRGSRAPQAAAALGVVLTQDPGLSPVLSQQQSPGQPFGVSGPPSTFSQDEYGGMPSPLQSPSAHAAPQQQQQQPSPGPSSPAAAAAAGQQGSRGWSPQAGDASPRARSRLSRSRLGWMGPVSSKPAQQQQQQQGLGQSSQLARGVGPVNSSSGYAATSLTADAAGGRGAAGMAAVREACGGSEAGDGAAGLPIELALEAWLHQLLFELLLMLSMMDEPCEAVWQSALGCLLHLTTQGGHWVASSCSQLPPAAAAALLDACVTFHWSQELHARLVQMAVNLLYLSDHSSGQQHGAVYAQRSFGMHTQQQRQREQQQEQQKEGLKAGVDAAAAAALASPEDVSVTLDTLGGSKGGKQQQQQERQEEVDAAEPAQHNDDWQDGEAGGPAHAGVDSGAADDARSTGQHSSKWGARGSQLGDLDLPWQLHAGPVDEQQLAAFGGPAKLLQHLCQAGSVEAQRTLLVPLLQVLMPPDVPDTTQLAILQALCARPSCLAALQAAVSAGLPGWSGCVVLAVQQQLGAEGLDVPLLSCLLLRLEQLSMQRMGALAGSAAASRGSAASASAGGGSSSGSSAGSQQQQQEEAQPQQQQAQLPQLPAEVQLALQVTLQQLRGELPSRPQARPGLQAADTTVYQVPAEVQGSWKALRALCWCNDELAKVACRHWLQQLLAVTLQQSLKGAILLPLPGVQQCMSSPADAAAAGSAAGVAAACEAWSEVLQQLVVHCPRGTDLLVDALQLHMASCKLHMHHSAQQQPQQEQHTSAAAGRSSGQQQQQQRQRQRAAAARECVQAWAFVCQWVMQARVANSQAALTRLAAMAQSMACVCALPEWPAMAGQAAAAVAADGVTPAAAAAAADSFQGPGQLQQQQQGQGPAAAAVDASTESLALTGIDTSRDFEAGLKGVPRPEPSSEPSALARLWAGTGATVGQAAAWGEPGAAGRPGDAAAAAGSAAAAAALAAAEGVCWPQAFLTGCAVLIQQMAQVLSGASLALLLVRLLQCRPPSRAGDRGFHGRPSSSRAVPAAATAGSLQQGGGQEGVMPCPVLYPWSDGRQDLQLGLVLMLISSCSSDAESFAEFGLEAVTQQVLSGCTDPRACLLVSQFMLEHLMQQQKDRYWTALRHLVAAAQAANDERLLGNPFLQLVTLLSDQQTHQQQQQPHQQQRRSGS